jgi:hypothetical protein
VKARTQHNATAIRNETIVTSLRAFQCLPDPIVMIAGTSARAFDLSRLTGDAPVECNIVTVPHYGCCVPVQPEPSREMRLVRACLALLLGTVLLVPECGAAVLEKAGAVATGSQCLRQTPEVSVVELLELLGVFANARAQTNTMVEQLRGENPKVPEGFWSSLASGVADHATLVSLYAPIYWHHLSQQDICTLVSFYRSPLGAHYLHAGPQIQEATRDAAQAWAGTIALELLRSAGEPAVPDGPTSPPPASQTQLEDARTAAIHELLRRSGDLGTAQQMMGITLDRLRQGSQQVALPPAFWDDARKRLLNEDALLRLWTPAYVRQFTDAEIRGLLEFYRSAAGSRYAVALPAIETERLEAGRQLGRDVAKRAVREVFGPLPQWRMLHPANPRTKAPDLQGEGNPQVSSPH